MWLEVEIDAAGEAVHISGRGSEGERPAPHTMSLGVEALMDLAGKVGRAARGGKALDPAVVQQAQALHDEVLQGELRDVFARLNGATGERLLVRLFVGDPKLHGVPWEALCKPGTSEGFLGTDPRVLLARGVRSSDPWKARDVQGAVRVLGIAPGSGKGRWW